MEIDKGELEELLQKQATMVAKETERYIGVLAEDFNQKLDVVMEAVQPIPEMQAKLTALTQSVETIQDDVSALKEVVSVMAPTVEATFEKVGEIAVDVEIIKETVKDHEQRLQKIETR